MPKTKEKKGKCPKNKTRKNNRKGQVKGTKAKGQTKDQKKTNSDKEEKSSQVGRKSEFDPSYHIPLAIGLARGGATKEEIAKLMKKARSTVYKWAKEYPLFADALEGGKKIAVQNIVNKVYRRAEGYEFEEVSIEYERIIRHETNPNDPEDQITIIEEVPVKRKVTRKHVPADMTAANLYLTNTAPDEWKNRSRVDVDGNLGVKDESVSQTVKQIVKIPGVREAIVAGFRSRTRSGDRE